MDKNPERLNSLIKRLKSLIKKHINGYKAIDDKDTITLDDLKLQGKVKEKFLNDPELFEIITEIDEATDVS